MRWATGSCEGESSGNDKRTPGIANKEGKIQDAPRQEAADLHINDCSAGLKREVC
jgi:hypothetical protein